LARNGAAVTISYVSDSVTKRAHALADKIKADGGRATLAQTTVDTPEGAQFLVQETLKSFETDHIDNLGNFPRFISNIARYRVPDFIFSQ
jgi:NAD(P)-dependent dehydrogenase (short-subunit alcohol dehydrogenase family)